jgi:hypothetical protein
MRANVHHVSCRSGSVSAVGCPKTRRIPTRDCIRGVARHRTFYDHVYPVSRNFYAQGFTRLRRCDPVRSDRGSTAAKRPTERRDKGCRRVSLIDPRLVRSKPHRRICLILCVRTVDGTEWAEVATSRARPGYIIEKKRLCVTIAFQMLSRSSWHRCQTFVHDEYSPHHGPSFRY